jgi:AGCS family alanine or glycine:cation symporter
MLLTNQSVLKIRRLSMVETLDGIVSRINGVVWGWPMIILLFGTHIFLTIRLRFIQRYIGTAFKLYFVKDKGAKGDVSQFAALQTAMAATTGTGNIVGVAMAICLGGPGAIFWLWCTGLFGIATKYSEGLLAVKYRVKTSTGTMLGGPMYALERGLNMKWLAVLFSVFTCIAAFGIGNFVQANAIATMAQANYSINPHITGIFLMVITFLVVVGGIKSIASFSEKIIPAMCALFIICNIIIVFYNIAYVPEALRLIITNAFTPRAAGGGFVGATVLIAMRFGIARGLFSNESGLGSAPLAAASATTINPVRQALVSMSGTFIDTIIMCFLTGLMLITTILRTPGAFEALESGAVFTAVAFQQIPVIGPIIITFGLFLFAWTTTLGWCFYGERTAEYLLGKKALMPYRVIWCIAVYIGSVVSLSFVWNLADMFNAFMAFPNLVSLLLLSGVLVKETRKYLWNINLDGVSDDDLPVINK